MSAHIKMGHLANITKQSPSSQANSGLLSQETSRVSRNVFVRTNEYASVKIQFPIITLLTLLVKPQFGRPRRIRSDNSKRNLTGYWPLLRGGIVQSVPCAAAIFWYIVRPHLRSNHSLFIHLLSDCSRDNQQWTMELARNGSEFCWRSVSVIFRRDL
jgi:hypothetical protein